MGEKIYIAGCMDAGDYDIENVFTKKESAEKYLELKESLNEIGSFGYSKNYYVEEFELLDIESELLKIVDVVTIYKDLGETKVHDGTMFEKAINIDTKFSQSIFDGWRSPYLSPNKPEHYVLRISSPSKNNDSKEQTEERLKIVAEQKKKRIMHLFYDEGKDMETISDMVSRGLV